MSAKSVREVTLGFRSHLGWAAAVVLASDRRGPAIIERCRLELYDPKSPHSREPYHAAFHRKHQLDAAQAKAVVSTASRVVDRVARKSIESLLTRIEADGYRVKGAAILLAAPPPANLESAISSHSRVHMAEGALFRGVVGTACEAIGIPVTRLTERDLLARGARQLRCSEDKLQRILSEIGRPMGSPWAKDQKLAALAAWLAFRGSRSI